jgi:probable HAF family extracellular repeat protein
VSNSSSGNEAFRWTSSGGMVGLGNLYGNSSASAVTPDGTVVVGESYDASGAHEQAIRWTSASGMVALGLLPGGTYSIAEGVSADGNVVVGFGTTNDTLQGFRWSSATGMVGLGPDITHARAASADGSVIVGWATEAFIWTQANGAQRLSDVLVNNGVTGLAGWTLKEAAAISSDGQWVAGYGINPEGKEQAFIANVSANPNTDGDTISDPTDNCPTTANENQADTDADGRGNMCDNCRLVANATAPNTQCDADLDGFGNICDADLDNSLLTTATDYTILRNALNTSNANADLNCSGLVTTSDYTILRNRLNTAPGPGTGP